MYTIQENVRIVISLLKEYNIRHIVISPGGTNIPISQAVQDDSFFNCYSVADERSAMYFAIGLYLQLGEPIATSCTSAQATRNYIPGLTEAYYKHVPILAITTSKLYRFTYQDYMQAPDQTSLPKDSVKKSFDLPYISNDDDRILCIRQAKDAMLEITHRLSGPVQLNIRISDKENGHFECTFLPRLLPIKRYMMWSNWNDVQLDNKKILIVIGEHQPFTKEQYTLINKFGETHDSVIYVNNLSNYHGKYTVHANLLLSCMSMEKFIDRLKPDILITIGGQTGDYIIYGKLIGLSDCSFEHWRICEDGAIVDTYNKLTRIFECPIDVFFEKFKEGIEKEHKYYDSWIDLNNSIINNVDLPFSNVYLAQQLYNDIPKGSYMNYAILNSLRAWNYFKLDPTIKCYSNVAAFGIDGCMSTLIGESINTEELCFLVTGDLAFFYDMNALGIRHIKNNVRILLINNNGGAEFKIMAGRWSIELDRYISASGHNGNAKGWSETNGFKYMSAYDKGDFLCKKAAFLKTSEQSIVFEIFTNPEDEVLAINALTGSNSMQSIEEKVKQKIKHFIKRL